ncbi:hypothetical protein IT568_02850 [bacterium]|nr:hypothetical protein [bacterium]
MLHKIILYTLWAILILVTILIGYDACPYFCLSLVERQNSELHELYRASGIYGHTFGTLGLILMVVMLAYVWRKQMKFMQNWGNLDHWLDYHIWMGCFGCALATYHTSFRFGGIVSIAYWSMFLVFLSGILGKYLYSQLPRNIAGNKMSLNELHRNEISVSDELQELIEKNNEVWMLLESYSDYSYLREQTGWQAIFSILTQDIALLSKLRKVRQTLKEKTNLSNDKRKKIMVLLKKRHILVRKQVTYETMQTLLQHWHIFHKPFVIIMFLVLVVHICVASFVGKVYTFKDFAIFLSTLLA